MNAPDPKANTTTEAYLAYKAGYLEESELKPVLYEPYLHFDAWLAYWAGLTDTYPNKGPGKNLASLQTSATKTVGGLTFTTDDGYIYINGTASTTDNFYFDTFRTTSGSAVFSAEVTGYTNKPSSNSAIVLQSSPNGTSNWTSASTIWLTSTEPKSQSVTLDDTKYYRIRILVTDTSVFTNATIKPQLELGSTATEYEPYTIIPEMLTDEEALVAYLSGVTDTYPEEIKDPYDVRIVGYLKHLVSARWPEPDYPVNNEEFYLSTMEPTHTSNSEPSSDIELNTAEGKIISVEAYGDTTQQTYSGKNILPSNGLITQKINDVTFTPIYENGILQYINVDGTASANTTYDITNLLSVTSGVTYTISGSSGGSDNTYRIWVNSSLAFPQGNRLQSRNGSGTATAAANDTNIRVYIQVQNGVTLDNQKFYPQIEIGLTDTSYEPYVGGIPAPNPDYPQDIHVVTGTQTIKATGKNLFNFAGWVSTSPIPAGDAGNTTINELLSNGVIVTGNTSAATIASANSKGWFRPSFHSTTSQYRVHLEATTTITVSADVTLLTLGYDATMRIYFDGTNAFTPNTDHNLTLNQTVRISQTFNNVPIGDYFPIFTLASNQVKIENIQIEASSTATDYQPYQSQSYTVNLGSTELCKIGDYQDYIYKSGDDWYVHKAIGKSELGSLTWITGDTNVSGIKRMQTDDLKTTIMYPTAISVPMVGYCSHYYMTSDNSVGTYGGHLGLSCYTNGSVHIYDPNYNTSSSASAFTTWLQNNNVVFYYVLATPTDTKITDATLIGQLDALADADTYNEKTYIKVTATDPNLPALLKVEAYKY